MKKLHKIILLAAIAIICIGTASIYGYTTGNNSEDTQPESTSNITVESISNITVESISNITVESTSIVTEETTSKNTATTTEAQTYNKVKTISLSQSVLNITKGKKGVINAKLSYYTSKNSKNEAIVWHSKNPDIAKISDKGIITAVNIGKTYIICSSKSGLVKARCKIVVREPYNSIHSISLDKKLIRLNKGDKRVLTPSISYGKRTSYTPEPISWSSSNNKIATVNKNGVVKGKANGTVYITIKSDFTNKSVKCKVVVQKVKYVAFTFDDGPGIYTNKLLDCLEKYHSQATFFVLGNKANSFKDELNREHELGMEIGSHTYSHKNLKTLSKSDIISEITKTNKAISKIIGEPPSLLRPPYGNYNKAVSKHAGVPMIYWSVDTLDWKYKKTGYVTKTILKQTKDLDIVLLHDIHETSVKGFIKALPKLRKKGFELVTVSELYKIKGRKMKKGVMYFGPNKD